jgi:hypothetical protein
VVSYWGTYGTSFTEVESKLRALSDCMAAASTPVSRGVGERAPRNAKCDLCVTSDSRGRAAQPRAQRAQADRSMSLALATSNCEEIDLSSAGASRVHRQPRADRRAPQAVHAAARRWPGARGQHSRLWHQAGHRPCALQPAEQAHAQEPPALL